MLTDERYLRYTENGLVVNPNWEISNYNSTTGSFIKELIATTNSSGNLYGLAITNSGQAWKLKKEIAPFVEIAGQVAGSNYKKAVLGDAYFYTLSSTDLIDRLDIDPGTGKVFVGNSLSIAHHLSYHSDKLLVANNDGDISRIILMNGGTSIDSNTDQSLTIYPDRINVLKKDKVQDRLYAYGDDGLIYLLNGLGDTFEPIKNNINKNIYNAVSSDFNMCFVGEKGLAKVGSTNGNVLNHFDLKLSFSQTVSSTFGNTDFHGVELASNNRLYIVGEYGAFLYNPNFGDFTGNDFVTIVNQENINLWDVSELSGTGNVFISGNNGLIQKQYGSTGIVNQQLFIPSIKDIHFKDGASATIVADNFVVRTTSNGGGSWKIALPQGSIAPTATYDKVWTLDNGKSLLLGNGNTLVHDRNSGITGTAFNSTHVRAVGKGSNNDNIFIVDDLSIKRVNLSTLASIPISTLTSPAQANAIHTFTNGDHIVVGNNGLYKHFNAGGVEISSSTGISSSVNFNDVAFKDHINGIIVGDDGIYYQTKNQTISPTGYMSNTNWELKNLIGIDPLGVNNANIYSLAIASSVDILIGGENPSANSGAQYPYVRKIYDAGGRYSNRFYYDKLGRLVVSQNARQEASTSSALNGKYSYTLYDELGRVIEVGEKTENTGSGELQFKTVFGANVGGVFNPSTIDDMRLKLWVDGSGARSEVTKSYYDKPIINGLPSAIVADVHTQRQRIVHVTYEEIFDGDDQTFDHATHYSYDIHGNVETLLQDNKKMEDNFPSLASQRFKRMDYSYDLLSGNVHRMSVQNGESDQWHHAYVYDADNRIEKVYTNTRAPLTEMNRLTQNKEIELSHNADWQNDAQYYYYDHGPLARVEIGQNNLQGVDYYYNLQGWLKGVNSSVLSGENDPGSDSHPDSLNGFFGKDVFGFGLHYYNGDYKAIGGAYSSSATSPIASVNNTSHADGNSYDLYNGNIRYMQTAITNPLTREEMPMLNAYKYDQLNRLKESRSYENGLSTNTWNPSSYGSEYYNAFTYDAMGNILTQERHNRAGQIFDDLKYNYQMDGNGNLLRNRLYSIKDDTTLANVMEDDIEDMDPFISAINQINTHNNYSYDAEGRLVKDKQEEIDTIIWTVSGKVKEIRRSLASEKKNVIFDYDAMGNRIAKHIYNNQTAMLERSTYYILDAQGNQLSMYDHKVTDNAVVYYLADRNIYGSSRLGSLRDTVNMFIPTNLPSYGVVGNRNYELSNHLGNVLAVVNDIKYPLSSDNTTIDSYEVGISNVFDYSPFGAPLDGRTVENIFHQEEFTDTSTVLKTIYVLKEMFETASNWEVINNYTEVTYPSGRMRVRNSTSGSRTIGVKKDFIAGTGEHTVSFDVTLPIFSCIGGIVMGASSTDSLGSGFNASDTIAGVENYQTLSYPSDFYAVVEIRDENNSIVLKDSTNITATHSYTFSAPQGKEYNISLYSNRFCPSSSFHIDNMFISYDTLEVVTGNTIIVSDTLFIINNDFENPIIEPNGAGVKIDGWTHYSPSTTLSVEPHNGSDWLKVVSTNGTHGAHQGFSVEPGETYTFEIDLHRPAGMNKEINVVIWKNTGPSGAYTLHVLNTDGSNTFNYTATSSNIYIQIRQAGTYYLDNIKMYRTYQDTVFVGGFDVDMAYRYGFNGMEKDDQIKGKGNSYDFGARMYDPRVGRWLSIDPMAHLREWVSPYNFVQNNPINRVDPTGARSEEPKDGDTRVENGRNEVYVDGSWGYDATGGEEVEVVGKENQFIKSLRNRIESAESNTSAYERYQQQEAEINADNLNPGIEDGRIQLTGSRYSDGRYYESCLSCHSPSGAYNDDMVRLGWVEFGQYMFITTSTGLIIKVPAGMIFGNAARGVGNLKIPVYRVYGGGAGRFGNYWSPINPKLYRETYQNFAK